MAVWVTRPEKKKEINDYFSSINSMSLRIIEDIRKVEENYGASWEKLTVEEQEEKINEWMVPQDVWKQYPLPKTKGLDVFPTLKLDSGQKIVELHSARDQNDSPMWRDEHSDPFTLESRSQMDLRLPSSDGKKMKKKKKSSLEKDKLPQNGGNGAERNILSELNGGFFKLKSTKEQKPSNVSAFEYFGLSSSTDNVSLDTKSHVSGKNDSEKELYDNTRDSSTIPKDTNVKSNCLDSHEKSDDLSQGGANVALDQSDFKNDFLGSYKRSEDLTLGGVNVALIEPRRDLPDVSFDADFLESYEPHKKINLGEEHKFPEPEILPSSELSKAYNELEFLDLYPQPKMDLQKSPKGSKKGNEAKNKTKSEKRKKKKMEKENPPKNQDAEGTVLPVACTKPKKSHRKKSSSGSFQVNPRSSLTLDGAIHNLEIAVEMNKQGTSPQVKHEKVFGDEDDLLKQIEKDTDLENWLPESPSQGSPLLLSKEPTADVQKTGFDFLDNW